MIYAIFLVSYNVNNNTGRISIITFEAPKERKKLLDKINWKICEIKMQRIFYIRKS